jgi:hypothetical protein
VFGAEWPSRRTFPNRIARDGETLVFDGVAFTVHDLGPGESHSDSIWLVNGPDPVAFVGDVVLNRVHAYMADGHTGAWLENLDRVRRICAGVATLHPGHGAPGPADILDWQRQYLTAYRNEVRSLAGGRGSLTEQEKEELVSRMKNHLATDRLEFLIGLGADAVASELRGSS